MGSVLLILLGVCVGGAIVLTFSIWALKREASAIHLEAKLHYQRLVGLAEKKCREQIDFAHTAARESEAQRVRSSEKCRELAELLRKSQITKTGLGESWL